MYEREICVLSATFLLFSLQTLHRFGGTKCPALSELLPCITGPCPVHCTVSPWSAWPRCTHSCGTGKRSRQRTVIKHAKHGGYVCPTLAETRHCNTHSCPVDCKVSRWASWTTCSKTCGGGTSFRTRSVVVAGAKGGKSCEAFKEIKECGKKVQFLCRVHSCIVCRSRDLFLHVY